jgi:hypothetical protein
VRFLRRLLARLRRRRVPRTEVGTATIDMQVGDTTVTGGVTWTTTKTNDDDREEPDRATGAE